MVAKTKDINFDSLNFVDGKISQSAKGKTAVYFSEVTKGDVADSISMQIKDGKLELSSGGKTLTLTNYSGIKYIKTDKSGKNYKLTDIIANNLVDNMDVIPYDKKKKAYIGTNYNDTYISTIENESFTGGKGINNFKYSGGKDVINLTKGEILNINLSVNYPISYAQGTTKSTKKDLVIKINDNKSLTLKNYYAKDTGATVFINGHNLVNETGYMSTVTAANYFEVEGKKATRKYTGSALADKVDARGVSQATDKKGKPLSTGVTINTGIGDDEIYGSNYNDAITAGVGNNIIHHYKGEGKDTIVLTKKENLTLLLDDIDKENLTYASDKKGNLVIKYTQDDISGSVTLKGFYQKDITGKNTIIKLITASGTIDNLREDKFLSKIATKKNYTGSWLAEEIDASEAVLYKTVKKKKVEKEYKDAGLSIKAGGGKDIVTGSNYSDTIKGGAGDDIITAGKGNDKLYGDAGNNTLIFTAGDGKDTIYSGKGNDTLVFKNVDTETVTMTNKKKDLLIKYGEGDSVTVKDYYLLNKKGVVKGVNTQNSVKNISFGDENGNETIYLGAGDSTVKIDMAMFGESEWSTPEYPDYIENCVKTIYLNDDSASTLTIDFDKAIFENGLGVFCRGTGQDKDLYISMSNASDPGYGIVIKNYFDEEGNPRTNQVKFGIWEYPEIYATERVQQFYTVPEYANADVIPWVNTFDVQPFGAYTGEIRGTNMPHEVLLYSSGFGDDTIYGGNGNRDTIYLNGGHDRVFAGEGDKHLNISGNQTNVEIYLGEKAETTTNINLGLVEGNVTSTINEAGDMNISWDCYANNADEPYVYTSTARIDKWETKTSQATISMSGNDRDNTLKAIDGADNTVDGGGGDDILIGGMGVDTFNFSYNSAHGIDTIQNYTAQDIIQFESASNAITVDYSKFKFYTTNAGKSLVINTKDLYSKESYVIVDSYFDSANKIDKIVGYNWSNPNSEASLAALYGNKDDLGSFDAGKGGIFAGTDNQDIFVAKSGENTFTGGKGVDLLYANGGETTFVFNSADENDILYQDGGNVTLKFNNATIEELSAATGYDKDKTYFDDLLIHYDGTNTLRVKDYYYTKNNKVTKIIDSTGTEYNMADYFKPVKYINSISDFYMYPATTKDDDIRITVNLSGVDIEGKKGSDIIRGSQYDEYLFTHLANNWNTKFDKTAGVVDTIYGGAGDDMIVGQSATNKLYGDEGNDMFIAFVNEGLNTIISDSSGMTDALNIYDETYDNLHFVFNADKNGVIDNNGLRILNNENFELWKANTTDENIKGISVVNNWNCIENYEEAGDANGCSHLTVAALETLKTNVVSWLTSGGRDYDSVSAALTSENAGDITELIAKFDISDKWVYENY